NYILQKAKEHEKAEDEWDYEDIEITSYRELMRFCISKGFTLEEIDFDIFLNDIDDEDDVDDVDDVDEDFNCWGYFRQLLEIIEQMDANNELPADVKHLHDFWKNSFWPEVS
ncbi:MAG: hypothetical protein J7M01_02295, partial [Candidatus Marinimicrobia bacterium]|nr:hypothetical protein [Candidatus Neomarinimicrobiota bacterium]